MVLYSRDVFLAWSLTPVRNTIGLDDCPIHCDPLIRPVRTPCGHFFCAICLTTWLKENDTCPMCREQLFGPEEDSDDDDYDDGDFGVALYESHNHGPGSDLEARHYNSDQHDSDLDDFDGVDSADGDSDRDGHEFDYHHFEQSESDRDGTDGNNSDLEDFNQDESSHFDIGWPGGIEPYGLPEFARIADWHILPEDIEELDDYGTYFED